MLAEITTTSGMEPNTGKPAGARRCLFGAVDRAELDELLQREMSEMGSVNRERWNFDFSRELPVAGGRYSWEAVRPEYVPGVYVRLYSTYKAARTKGPAAAAAAAAAAAVAAPGGRVRRRVRFEEDAENVRPLAAPAAPGHCSPAPRQAHITGTQSIS